MSDSVPETLDVRVRKSVVSVKPCCSLRCSSLVCSIFLLVVGLSFLSTGAALLSSSYCESPPSPPLSRADASFLSSLPSPSRCGECESGVPVSSLPSFFCGSECSSLSEAVLYTPRDICVSAEDVESLWKKGKCGFTPSLTRRGLLNCTGAGSWSDCASLPSYVLSSSSNCNSSHSPASNSSL